MYTLIRFTEGIASRQFSLREMINKSLGYPVLGNKELDEMIEKGIFPEQWKDQKLTIWFLGSTNFDEDGEVYVRTIGWNGDQFLEDREYLWLGPTEAHPSNPNTVDVQKFGWSNVFAVLDMETIRRPRQ